MDDCCNSFGKWLNFPSPIENLLRGTSGIPSLLLIIGLIKGVQPTGLLLKTGLSSLVLVLMHHLRRPTRDECCETGAPTRRADYSDDAATV